MLFASVRALADNNAGFLERTAADEFDGKRFADGFGGELRVNVLEARDGMAREGDENIADHDTGFVRGTFGLHVENDGGGFVLALERLPKRRGQSHGLQAYAEIATRNAAFLQ